MEFLNSIFNITETKELERGGQPIGIVEGYIATWDLDRGKDVFVKGCFSDSLQEHREKGRQVRLMSEHRKIIGGFPIDKVMQDDRGLFGVAEINLTVQEGREKFSLAKQGVIQDFSIGFSAEDVEFKDGVRFILKATIWEGSLVPEPMNPKANITQVKCFTSRDIMPKKFASISHKWNEDQAIEHTEGYVGTSLYEKDGEVKFNIADVVNNEVVIVPRAVFTARADLSGAKDCSDLENVQELKELVNGLYVEMKLDPPFQGDNVASFCLTEIRNMSKSCLTRVIKNCRLSREAVNYTVDLINADVKVNNYNDDSDLSDLNDLINNLMK